LVVVVGDVKGLGSPDVDDEEEEGGGREGCWFCWYGLMLGTKDWFGNGEDDDDGARAWDWFWYGTTLGSWLGLYPSGSSTVAGCVKEEGGGGEDSGGGGGWVQLKIAGVGSTLPDVSIALTWNVWLPGARLLLLLNTFTGLLQRAAGRPSILHW
jgi:hypothetical protein